MQVTIKDGCIGCGLCAGTCPKVFMIGNDGLAQVIAQPEPEKYDDVQTAADNCPVSVIHVE